MLIDFLVTQAVPLSIKIMLIVFFVWSIRVYPYLRDKIEEVHFVHRLIKIMAKQMNDYIKKYNQQIEEEEKQQKTIHDLFLKEMYEIKDIANHIQRLQIQIQEEHDARELKQEDRVKKIDKRLRDIELAIMEKS